jgi:two-component system, OmpR family, sensor histidine kinase MtrB
MPRTLANVLDLFSELARVWSGPATPDTILDRVAELVGRTFGFAEVEILLAEPGVVRPGVRPQAIVVPLELDGMTRGALVARGDASEADLAILRTVGSMTARAVARARHSEMLRDFISTASHELRSPMAVVHGVAATLHARSDALREDQARHLRATLYQQTTRVVELLEKLLDLSQLETGASELTPEWFRARDRIVSLIGNIAPDRLDHVRIEIAPTLRLYADPHAVERVLANLVLNALRHGEPPVRVRDRGDGCVSLLVEDCGRGVDPAFVPRLFDRFSRGARGRAIDTRGAGLGLAIARSYAEAIGADLSYEPRRPRGARFALSFPPEAVAA